jgi:hypothetical protein
LPELVSERSEDRPAELIARLNASANSASKVERRIAGYLLANLAELPFETGASLAEKAGVSAASISRFDAQQSPVVFVGQQVDQPVGTLHDEAFGGRRLCSRDDRHQRDQPTPQEGFDGVSLHSRSIKSLALGRQHRMAWDVCMACIRPVIVDVPMCPRVGR